jgi:uncharacterized protein YaiI (UPF0178 family)
VIAIFVDGDACPVKDETYLVASRHGVPVAVVSNSRLWVPEDLGVQLIVVEKGPDVADDYIAEHTQPGDVVVTADVPLAARCLEAGACVIGSNGREFTEDSIGSALATRDLKSQLREGGEITGGPRPMSDADRSRFSARLDDIVVRCLRRYPD